MKKSIRNISIGRYSKYSRGSRDTGFTLIELLVVISIIGMLSSIVLASLNTARSKARDAERLSDMKQIRLALELFFDDNGHYPGSTNESVSNSGEMIGDDNGPIEQALSLYLPSVPSDPRHDGVVYFYSYDPRHCVTGGPTSATLAFNKAEADSDIRDDVNGCGGDMNQGNADYVETMLPPGP